MDYLLEKYRPEVVLEKYVGRRPELVQIEKELEKIVSRMKDNLFTLRNRSGDDTARDLNMSDENKKIEKLFKKFFKLKDFVLNWIWSPIPNAYTAIKCFQILDKNFVKGKDGRDFNEKLFIGVQIHTGLVTLMEMDAGELMGIILHEIGHSFNATIAQVLAVGSPIVVQKSATEDLVLGTGIVSAIFNDLLGMNKIATHVRRYGEDIKDALKPLYKVVNGVEELAAYGFSLLPQAMSLINPKNLISVFFNPAQIVFLYDVEKHSDGFAVDYGYGKELASALNKLDRSHGHPKMDIPVLSWIYAFDDMIYEMILEPLTGYPTMHNRQRSALDRLRTAAKDKDLDPRVKKELQEQIKAFEAYYDDYMSLQGNENKKFFATWLYRKFVDKFFKGKMDIRELVYALSKDNPNNHDYAKEYDKLEKKIKAGQI